MYKITFPIPAATQGNSRILLPVGLARDLIAQLKYEPQLRIICPSVGSPSDPTGYHCIDVGEYPGFSCRLLPWCGGRREFWANILAIRRILIDEARTSTVWHSTCSISLWDVTSLSYIIGRKYAPGLRILGLDADPAAVLEQSGTLFAKWKARRLARRYVRWASEVDATILMGEGVLRRYGASAKLPIFTNAVWLNEDELATVDQVEAKFSSTAELRMVLASRLESWKGADDVISALAQAANDLGTWTLQIVGEGIERDRLVKLAAPLGNRVVFKNNIPYGTEFFSYLRSFHIALIPTRATEEARIAYDAAASGCVLVHSGTSTLEAALHSVPGRFSFEPGNVKSLALALRAAVAGRDNWCRAAILGIEAMRGRTIDEMHRTRYSALKSLRAADE